MSIRQDIIEAMGKQRAEIAVSMGELPPDYIGYSHARTMTERLREWLRALSCGWSEGYRIYGGERMHTEDVTQVFVNGHWISIEEAYDGTFTITGLEFADACNFLKPWVTS